MAELKTKPTKVAVKDFMSAIEDEQKRKDFFRDLKLKVKKNGGNWENSLIFEGFDG